MEKTVNPEMIILARQSRGLTQKELASRLAVSQGWLSRVESGLREVSHEALPRLAEELGYPEGFFYQTDKVYGFGITEVFHRRFQDVPSKVLDMIHAKTNIYCMQIRRMLRGVDLGAINFPALELDEFNGNVEDVARQLRATWGLPRGPIQNLTRAIEDARGIVVQFDFGNARVDAVIRLTPDIDMPPLFFINVKSPGDRLRFTLSHELGHIIMHRRIPSSDMEEQADRFAAEFLMPAKEIRPMLTNLSLAKLADLKVHWKVSMAALIKRAQDLGTITPTQARALWAEMSRLGYRTKEPAEVNIPVETPELLQEIVNVYRGDMGYSAAEFAAMINLCEQEVRQLYYIEPQGKHLKVVK